jgi:hypothetical protein
MPPGSRLRQQIAVLFVYLLSPKGRTRLAWLACRSGATLPRIQIVGVREPSMQTFQVQIWPEGMSPKAYEEVEANTEKEAAEKLYGKPLREEGFLHQLRAIVRTSDGIGNTVSFYELRRLQRSSSLMNQGGR